jgi:hypothetical protein
MSDYRGHASCQRFDVTRRTNDPGAPDNFTQTTDHRGNHEPTAHHLYQPEVRLRPTRAVHHHLPSGHNVCTEIAHAIYKVAAGAKINPRIESQSLRSQRYSAPLLVLVVKDENRETHQTPFCWYAAPNGL